MALLLGCETAWADRFVEYLHIEASSGASGGGHAAVRFADRTYHYVYVEPGLIESAVDPNENFDFAYRALGNRSIHVSRIPTTDEEYEALEDAFEHRHVTQQAQLALRDAVVDDLSLIAYLREQHCMPGRARVARPPRLRGAGYFKGASGAPETAVTALAELRSAVERAYGAGYLEKRARAVDRDLEELAFSAPTGASIVEGVVPARAEGFAERYRALATARLAIDALLHTRAPAVEAYRRPTSTDYQLTRRELDALAERAASLRVSLLRLAASGRHDWGYPMLIGMARLVAIDALIRSGRFVVPDSFDGAAASVPVEAILSDEPVVAALLRERQADLSEARADLARAPPTSEAVWSRFEVAMSAALELEEAVGRRDGRVREYSDTMLPSRSAEVDDSSPQPLADCETLNRWAASASAEAARLDDELQRTYAYDVVSRNCVTEIFRTVKAAGLSIGGREGDEAALGFIPFVSAAAVNRADAVSEQSLLPSYRAYWLSRLRKTDGRLTVALRESNTLTSALRHPDDLDDTFLFYTDATVALRPLYGAINTGVAAGASVAGLFRLPFDGGRSLITGVRSIVFSLPELVFVNFRKGRNGVLPRDWQKAVL